MKRIIPTLALSAVLCMAAARAWSQEDSAAEAGNADKLAKQLANPIASLISVPLQSN